MNYRHAFHAGNFADVHKHVALLTLLDHLQKKSAPFFFLDTHAGCGAYDLESAQAQRSDEWRQGIERLRTSKQLASPLLQRYLTLAGSTARSYSGSPLIAAAMLRESDRAVFVERQAQEAVLLQRALGNRKRVTVLEDDGYAALKAYLPPKENRGMVLLDPPYENESEFADVGRASQLAYSRWPNGTYCIWYPIKPGNAQRRMQRVLVDAGIRKILLSELNVRPADSPLGLNGSGLLIVNPPWQLDEQMRSWLPELHRVLAGEGAGGVRIEWLVGE
jgi:23S rRNA (adenine2030-N6)-methyltransferase